MWQLRRLSTNEALSEAGPLPNNWGPIFGLHGFLDKIGDLSWIGPDYSDKGWVKLSDQEVQDAQTKDVMVRIEREEAIAQSALKNLQITVAQKYEWNEYLLALQAVKLKPDLSQKTPFPARPNEQV